MPVFEQPVKEAPDPTPAPRRYERAMAAVMDSPGEWFKIGTYKSANSAYQAALNLRNGTYRIVGQPEDWEIVHDDNAVFVKYIREQTRPKASKKTTKKATKTKR